MAPTPTFAIDTRVTTALDGTRIAFYRTEPGAGRAAPAIVVAAAVGAPCLACRGLIDHFRDRYRLVTWDYRGLFGSGHPGETGVSAFGVDRHAADLLAVMDAEGIERAGAIGWGDGARVVLEATRRHPDRFTNIVLLSGPRGTAGRHSALSGVRRALPRAIARRRWPPPWLDGAGRAFVRSAAAPAILRWAGVAGVAIDPKEVGALLRATSESSMAAILDNLRAIRASDPREALRRLPLPALFITGDRDRGAAPSAVFQMARLAARSEVLVVRGGTALAAIEFPDLVHLRIERFYEAGGDPPPPAPQAAARP